MENYVNKEEFEQYKRFVSMTWQSVFLQIEDLKAAVRAVIPNRPIPQGRKEVLDKQVENLSNKMRFVEQELIKIKVTGSRAEMKIAQPHPVTKLHSLSR